MGAVPIKRTSLDNWALSGGSEQNIPIPLDGVPGAEKSTAKAEELGWTVVSMKNDWTTVFAAGVIA